MLKLNSICGKGILIWLKGKKKKKKKKPNGQDDVKWVPLHLLMPYKKTLTASCVYKLEPKWMQKKAMELIGVSYL